MSYDRIMPTRRVIISVADGLHARPVAELARITHAYALPTTIQSASGAVVDLSSVLAVMELDFAAGDEVILATVEHPSAYALLEDLTAVLDPDRCHVAAGDLSS